MYITKSTNFDILKNSPLSEFYNDFLDTELIIYRDPTNKKVYIDSRKIIESIVTGTLKKYSLKEENTLSANLKKCKIYIPDEIYTIINKLRLDGNSFAHNSINKIKLKPLEALIQCHKCISWYLKFITNSINKTSIFKIPSNVDLETSITKLNKKEEENLKMIKRIDELTKKIDKELPLKKANLKKLTKIDNEYNKITENILYNCINDVQEFIGENLNDFSLDDFINS